MNESIYLIGLWAKHDDEGNTLYLEGSIDRDRLANLKELVARLEQDGLGDEYPNFGRVYVRMAVNREDNRKPSHHVTVVPAHQREPEDGGYMDRKQAVDDHAAKTSPDGFDEDGVAIPDKDLPF